MLKKKKKETICTLRNKHTIYLSSILNSSYSNYTIRLNECD